MEQKVIKKITTPIGKSIFQIRFIKNEGIGLLTTKDNENYLILDSLDYWYDVIQDQYPRKKKCSCKNDFFEVEFHYIKRTDYDDIKLIEVFTICTNCNKKQKVLSIDIKYSPTDTLLSKPIIFCEKPNIKYKYQDLNAFWNDDDLIKVFNFFYNTLNCNGYGWYWCNTEKRRKFHIFTYNQIVEYIQKFGFHFLKFYFSFDEICLDDFINPNISEDALQEGVYLNNANWRRKEVIKLSSIKILDRNNFNINNTKILYFMEYCTQFIDKGNIVNKSEPFEKATIIFENWLKENFTQKRGKHSFDSLTED